MRLRSPFVKENNRWAITDKLFFSLFMTGAIIEFSQVGAGVIDGLVISRFLGSYAMAAEGLVHPIYSIMGVISGLLAVGTQVRCAQMIGRGNIKDFSRYVSATLYVGTSLSLLFTAIVLIFADPFVVFLGATGSASYLAEPAAKYLTGIGIGVPPLIMTAIIAPVLQLDTGRKTIRTGALIEAVSNVLMDLVAVKMNLGIFGVGLATAVASYLNLLYQLTFFLKKDRMLHLVKPDVPFKEYMKMLTNGSEKAIGRLANTIRPIILNRIIISYGGAIAMSVLSIRNSFSNFAEIFGAGIASAVALLTGFYFGEINEEAIEEVDRYGHKLIVIFSGSVCALMLIFSRTIAGLYITEQGEVLNMAAFAIGMLALQNPLRALIASRIKYLQATQRKLNMNVLVAATQLVFVLPTAYILGRLFGVYGILACYTASDALTLIVILIIYQIKTSRMKPERMDFLNLPDEYHLHPGDVISLDIRDEEDVSLCSEQIMMFCSGHKINKRISYYASLAFEEMASNIVTYGFPENHDSDPMIDLRVVITESKLVLRLCDNCPLYDIKKQIAAVNEEDSDPLHNIGTRIVSKIASDIVYLNTFETNNVIISFDLEEA